MRRRHEQLARRAGRRVNPTKPRRTPPPRRPQNKHRCTDCGKTSFPTQGAAYAAALRLSRHVGPIRAYKCPGGHGWHLTRRPTWKER